MSLFKQPQGFYRELAKIAIPTSLQSILFAGLGVADTMMVGSLGENAIAAVGLGTKLHFVFLLIIIGFGNACSILVAQYYGARQLHNIQRALILTVAVSAAAMIIPTLLFGFSPALWLPVFTQNAELQQFTAVFLQLTAPLMLLTSVVVSAEHALRAMGHTVLPLIVGAGAVLLNILLNYLLIFGAWGFPEMGVAGAALGTTLSRLIQMFVLLFIIQKTVPTLALKKGDLAAAMQRQPFLKYIRFAWPIAFNFGLWGLGSTLYHIIASRMGPEPLAVMSMLAPIESTLVSLFIGVGSAAAVLMGRELGQNNQDRAWELSGLFINGAACLAIVMAFLLWLSKGWILSPYSGLDDTTWQSLTTTFSVMCAVAWIKVHNMMSIVAVLRSGGDNDWCLKMDVSAMWLIGLPLTAILALVVELPFHLIYLCMFTEEVIKLFASRWRVTQKQWMNNLTSTLGDEAKAA